ncbi:flagellar basal-body MS-ring/collar protein FliF [Sphingomonas sp. SAFR-052]|uniref:flagellar basal-body MS-ring/collar protein FliF n=1 Tax=Sphingomonas sp. SAFR-052 TaxID=3436867 RepID=UPI003F7E3C7D
MSDAVPSPRRQWLLIGGVFVVVLGLLGGAYWAFLRDGYSTLADHVRPGEAAAIVAELDKRGTPYELRDGGTTVLVPSGEADATRLAMVRADVGEVGFELFNKSDMGLTNFAQKINYQRALQGELVRTIALMDGVESARVHLALPERTLFRDDRIEPSAAVTVQMRGAAAPDAAKVAGIQRLVAAAVPDLPAQRVVVLDADGRVVSADAAPQPVEGDATTAVENYYKARARAAIEGIRPGLRHELRVKVLAQGDAIVDPANWTPGEADDARNFRLRIALVTPKPLDAGEQAALAAAIRPAVGLDDAQGDMLSFQTGMSAPPVAPTVPTYVPPIEASEPVAAPAWWPWALAALGIFALIAVALRRVRATRLSGAEQEAFAALLRRRIEPEGGEHVAG